LFIQKQTAVADNKLATKIIYKYSL